MHSKTIFINIKVPVLAKGDISTTQELKLFAAHFHNTTMCLEWPLEMVKKHQMLYLIFALRFIFGLICEN